MLAGTESPTLSTARVLSGYTVAGDPADVSDALVTRHLADLGAVGVRRRDHPVALHGPTGTVTVGVDWCSGDGRLDDEVTSQAAYGLMAVHGWATGGPARLGVSYVSTVAGALATQGVLAAILSSLRGRPVQAVTVPAAAAAMMAVSQHLAAGSTADPEYSEPSTLEGRPPPFQSADGVRFELETLDPEPWRRLWTTLGAPPSLIGHAWRAFVLRYATARSPLPLVLHDLVNGLTFPELRRVAAEAGVAVQPLRCHAERLADLDDGRIPRAWKVMAQPWDVASVGPDIGPGGLPLSGLTVVEAGRRIQGPLAGLILRLLGADVIRIESVGGDPLRGMPPMVGDCSARFLALNRRKHIVEVDLRQPVGRATVRDLVADADVFVHNWAPGKALQLGLDADDFRDVNPGLVYGYASGWGDARGESPPPGTDFMAQAHAGLGEHLRPLGDPPAGSLMTLLDVLGGLVAAEGLLAGLVARQRSARGQRVDSSLLSAAGVLQAGVLEGAQPSRPRWTELDVPIATADGLAAVATATSPALFSRVLGVGDLEAALAEVRRLSTTDAVGLLNAGGVTAVAVCQDPGLLATDPTLSQLLEVDGCAFVRPPWRFAT